MIFLCLYVFALLVFEYFFNLASLGILACSFRLFLLYNNNDFALFNYNNIGFIGVWT